MLCLNPWRFIYCIGDGRRELSPGAAPGNVLRQGTSSAPQPASCATLNTPGHLCAAREFDLNLNLIREIFGGCILLVCLRSVCRSEQMRSWNKEMATANSANVEEAGSQVAVRLCRSLPLFCSHSALTLTIASRGCKKLHLMLGDKPLQQGRTWHGRTVAWADEAAAPGTQTHADAHRPASCTACRQPLPSAQSAARTNSSSSSGRLCRRAPGPAAAALAPPASHSLHAAFARRLACWVSVLDH